jgi:hypothetical protein
MQRRQLRQQGVQIQLQRAVELELQLVATLLRRQRQLALPCQQLLLAAAKTGDVQIGIQLVPGAVQSAIEADRLTTQLLLGKLQFWRTQLAIQLPLRQPGTGSQRYAIHRKGFVARLQIGVGTDCQLEVARLRQIAACLQLQIADFCLIGFLAVTRIPLQLKRQLAGRAHLPGKAKQQLARGIQAHIAVKIKIAAKQKAAIGFGLVLLQLQRQVHTPRQFRRHFAGFQGNALQLAAFFPLPVVNQNAAVAQVDLADLQLDGWRGFFRFGQQVVDIQRAVGMADQRGAHAAGFDGADDVLLFQQGHQRQREFGVIHRNKGVRRVVLRQADFGQRHPHRGPETELDIAVELQLALFFLAHKIADQRLEGVRIKGVDNVDGADSGDTQHACSAVADITQNLAAHGLPAPAISGADTLPQPN